MSHLNLCVLWQRVGEHGLTEAVPKRILDLMNVPGLTRENVASHLQVLGLKFTFT